MVCLPSLLSRPPAMSPDLKIAHPSMKQEFFPFVWKSDVTHQLRRYQVPTSVLEWHEYLIRKFGNSFSTGTSSCCVSHKCVEANLSPRVDALWTSETLSAALEP